MPFVDDSGMGFALRACAFVSTGVFVVFVEVAALLLGLADRTAISAFAVTILASLLLYVAAIGAASVLWSWKRLEDDAVHSGLPVPVAPVAAHGRTKGDLGLVSLTMGTASIILIVVGSVLAVKPIPWLRDTAYGPAVVTFGPLLNNAVAEPERMVMYHTGSGHYCAAPLRPEISAPTLFVLPDRRWWSRCPVLDSVASCYEQLLPSANSRCLVKMATEPARSGVIKRSDREKSALSKAAGVRVDPIILDTYRPQQYIGTLRLPHGPPRTLNASADRSGRWMLMTLLNLAWMVPSVAYMLYMELRKHYVRKRTVLPN
eukprot:m51a1_g7666 hypothetical protein (317) ;mRNA; f:458255-459417